VRFVLLRKMKSLRKLFTLTMLLLAAGFSKAQTVIYTQTFNTGSASNWSLNSSDVGGVTTLVGNQWLINNIYTAPFPLGTATPNEPTGTTGITGAPNSYYLHINCGPLYSSLYGSNCNFLSGSSGDTYFAKMNAPQSTTGYTGVSFSFWWLCNGSSTSVGRVYYRTSSTSAWTATTTPISTYYGSSSWAFQTITMAAFDNQPFLEFGFQFTDGTSGGSDPAFGVDDIRISGTSSTTTAAVATFTVSPNDTVCQDSCITFTSTSTGTIDSVNWLVSPGMTTAPFPNVNPFHVCFTAPGTYTVGLAIYNGGIIADTETHVIVIKNAPHPVVTKSGHTLTLTGATGYTNIQWYNGTTQIAGATNATYTYTLSGTYSVKVDSGGCHGSSNVFNTTGITNVNGTEHTYWVSSEGGAMILHAADPLDETLNILISDASGRTVTKDTWDQGTVRKDVSGISLPPGLYIVRIGYAGTIAVLKYMQQ
jgi:hypothetical protein